MLKTTEVKLTWKTSGFLLALGLAALGGVAVVLSGAEVGTPKEFAVFGVGCSNPVVSNPLCPKLPSDGVELYTSPKENSGTNDPLWLCVDDDRCCKKLLPQGEDGPSYVAGSKQTMISACGDMSQYNRFKLVASGGNTWSGFLESAGGHGVNTWTGYMPTLPKRLVLSTNRYSVIGGIQAKRGAFFVLIGDVWIESENVTVPFNFYPYPWNVKLKTSDVLYANTDDGLWFCVDDCCEKLTNAGEDNYERGKTDKFLSNCSAPTNASTLKLVATGDKAWMGNLKEIFAQTVEPTSLPLVLSTQSTDEISGIQAKRGVSFKKQADGHWHYDEDVPFDWFPFAWNVKLTTSGVALANTNDPLYLCVDDCCEELDNEGIDGIDDYEGHVPDFFVTNCAAPTDASSLKLVASGGDAWMGQLESVFGQTVHHSLQPLVLSTQPSDEIDGITAKRGVSFKKQADGEWHFDEDVPFDYFVWNVEVATSDVTYAGMDGSLRFCVDDCCEKLNNSGEDNYERGRIDHFWSDCKAPMDASTIKLLATSGDGWIGTLQNVYGTEVEEYELKLSTQSTDFSGSAKRGAVFKKEADGHWHWHSHVPY